MHDVRAQIVEVLVHRRGRRILVSLGHSGDDGDVLDDRLASNLGRGLNAEFQGAAEPFEDKVAQRVKVKVLDEGTAPSRQLPSG